MHTLIGKWYKRSHYAGFTLVELMVVIAIIGILAAIITPNAWKAMEKGRVTAAEADYKMVKNAVLTYYTDIGHLPENGAALVRSDEGAGPYIEKWPTTNQWKGENELTYDVDSNALYMQMSNVPLKSIERLKQDLGELVQESSDKGVVLLLVAEK